jgi:hypothetical protein
MLVIPLLLLLAGVLAPWPALAAENAVLYEVTETMKLKGHHTQRRVATAALVGWIDASPTSPLCPSSLADQCAITALASDNINLNTGKGPVNGEFAVVIQGDNPVDGAELVILKGTLDGKIDLSPAVLGGTPLGTLTGRWTARGVQGGPLQGVRAKGTLTGLFQLPFTIDPTEQAYYLDPVTLTPQPVLVPDELSLGIPTVRLSISFTQQ